MSLMAETETLQQQTPFEIFGGEEAVRRLTKRLYNIMETDPAAERIRAMHQADLSIVAEHVGSFITGWMGGPRDYFTDPDRPCIMSAHKPFDIGPEDRDAWMACFRKALAEEADRLDPQFSAAFEQAISQLADGLRAR